MGIDPTMNMSGPPPTGAGYKFCRSCSIELQTWYGKLHPHYWCTYSYSTFLKCTYSYSRFNRGGPGFSCAHPSIKIFLRIKSFFLLCVKMGGKMLQLPSWSGEFGTYLIFNWTWPRNRTHLFLHSIALNLTEIFLRRRPHQVNWCELSPNDVFLLDEWFTNFLY